MAHPDPRPALLLALALVPGLAIAAAAGCSAPAPPAGLAAALARGADGGVESPAAPSDGAPASSTPAATREVDELLDYSRAVARVNGKTIVLREVRAEIGVSWEHYLDRRPDLIRLAEVRLRGIVVRRLLVAEANRIGLPVAEDELERAEAEQRKQAEAGGTTLDQHARDMGTTRREMAERLREGLLAQRAEWYFTGLFPPSQYNEDFFRPSVDLFVTPDEVRAWGRANPEKISFAPWARIRLLDLRADEFRSEGGSESEARARCLAAAEKARDRALAGESFGDLVRELSQGFGREDGGLLPPMRPTGSERPEYRAWAFAPDRKAGDVSAPIPLSSGAVVLYLEDRSEGGERPIAEWGAEARNELEAIKRMIAWTEVRIRLVEEASIEPRTLREQILAWLEEERRGAIEMLPRPAEPAGRASAAPVR